MDYAIEVLEKEKKLLENALKGFNKTDYPDAFKVRNKKYKSLTFAIEVMTNPKSTHGGARPNTGPKKKGVYTISRSVTDVQRVEIDKLLYNMRKGLNLTITCANENELQQLTNHLSVMRVEVKN